VTVVEFSDFQCPFCSRYFSHTFPLILKEYVDAGKVQYIFRHFPLERIHLNAMHFALISECAHEQRKFWPMHDWLLTHQQVIDASDDLKGAVAVGLNIKTFRFCMSQDKHADQVRKDAADAVTLGLTGTPTFAIGVTPASGSSTMEATVWISGAQPIEAFRVEIDRLLK
jgi:protein-disulfide isomerase